MLQRQPSILNAIVIGVALAAGATWLSKRGERVGAPVETVGGRILATEIRHVRGSGPLALVEFSDFACEFCSRHARTTAHEIDQRLLKSGAIRHVFLNFPRSSHPGALKASGGAECAAQQSRFWEMHDLLFNGPAVSEENSLVNRARLLALEPLAFKECLQDVATVRQVKQDIKTGRRLGVNVTPTFFVGTVARDGSIEVLRRITGAAEYRQFERAVTDLGALVVLAGSRAPK